MLSNRIVPRVAAGALVLVLGAILALPGCRNGAAPASAPPAAQAAGDVPCGWRTSDWCPSPPGDPCGRHKDTAACRADKKCKGMPYRGESYAPCVDDGTGFARNCPSVGCISR